MRLVAIPDTHMPFHSTNALKECLLFIKDFQPHVVIQIGDLYDLFSWSRFPRSPHQRSVMSPEDEIADGLNDAKNMWRTVHKYAPRAKCYQIRGNHDVRFENKIMNQGMGELLSIFNVKQFWEFRGVHTVHDARQTLKIGDINIIHGHKTQLGQQCLKKQAKYIVGHSHRGGVFFTPGPKPNSTIWELNCGFLGDTKHEALRYRPELDDIWHLSFGVVDKFGPRLITV